MIIAGIFDQYIFVEQNQRVIKYVNKPSKRRGTKRNGNTTLRVMACPAGFHSCSFYEVKMLKSGGFIFRKVRKNDQCDRKKIGGC